MKLWTSFSKLELIILLIVTCYTGYLVFEKEQYYQREEAAYQKIIAEDPSSSVEKPYRWDAYSTFFYFLLATPFHVIMPLFPFLAILCGIQLFYMKQKSGYMQNELLREGYGTWMKKHLLKSWKAAFLLPAILLILFLGSIISARNFDFAGMVEFHRQWIQLSEQFFGNLPQFFFFFFLNSILISIFCINVGLIVSRKKLNFWVTILLSYLSIIGFNLCMEFVSGYLRPYIPNISGSVAIFNFIAYDGVISAQFMFWYAVILVVISTLIVLVLYRKKEAVLIENEK